MPLYIDIETYSSTDLKKAGVYRYAADPDFMILMCAWATETSPVRIAVGADEIAAIPGLYDPDTLKIAHNAAFERVCFGVQPVEQWDCTMALAAEWGYPRPLGELALALGVEEKDAAGTHLINFFCKPDRTGHRRLPEDHPERWEEFKAYCIQDVATLREIHQALPGWPTGTERQVYMADQRINDTGIQVDTEMAAAAVASAETNAEQQKDRMREITGVGNPGSTVQLTGWLEDTGLQVPNLQKATIDELLAGDALTPEQREVLQLRQELALVAAKKYTAALDRVTPADGRLRGAFQFFGAHTGRWAGRGVQLQNLPSASLESEDQAEDSILELSVGMGADAHTLKALVRRMFVGPFTVVDYSAIEARVIAWLAGEEWALEAFRAGEDIYVETAQRMSTPSYQMSRKEGKVATLALGYQGGVGSLAAMGAEGSREWMQLMVDQWRTANPGIVELWAEMDYAFRAGDTAVGDRLYVERDGRDRRILLPSGRYLCYYDLRARAKTTPWGSTVKQISFADPKKRGLRTDTYGGRLSENVTQAVARDVLAEALLRLRGAGHRVVGHVHDEILVEGAPPVDQVERIMTEQTDWSAGLPLAAEGFVCTRYRKD